MATATRTRTKTVKKTISQQYAELQKLMITMMGLEIGSSVEVVRAVEDNEMGWCGSAIDSVGDENYLVVEDFDTSSDNNEGICLSDGYWYPIFALRITDNVIKIDDYYNAVIGEHGCLTVGGVEIEFDILELIYETAKLKYNSYD